MELEEQDIVDINMTPLVDVSLALVLIFMVTMPLSVIHGITVQRQILEKYGMSTPQESVIVHLKEEGTFVQDHEGKERLIPYEDFGNVLSQLIQISITRHLLLESDRDVPHGQTVWVLDIAKQNGASEISLLETE